MKFVQTCCGLSKEQLEYHCDKHGENCPDRVLRFTSSIRDRPFMLLAANSEYWAAYCPWCGCKLRDTCIPELKVG